MTSASSSHSTTNALTIAARDLSKRFNREWIFSRLTYRFLPGNLYAITGPNGSGKSTLLQVLWGQVPQTSGKLQYVSGETEIPVDEVFRQISIATPYLDLIEEFTLTEMIHFHFRLKKRRDGVSHEELLRIMYLEDAAAKQIINFSSGMKQRLKLALALYTDAAVYFLDEPGTNLDKRAFDWYREQLTLLPQNALVFIASNDPEEYPANSTLINILDYKS